MLRLCSMRNHDSSPSTLNEDGQCPSTPNATSPVAIQFRVKVLTLGPSPSHDVLETTFSFFDASSAKSMIDFVDRSDLHNGDILEVDLKWYPDPRSLSRTSSALTVPNLNGPGAAISCIGPPDLLDLRSSGQETWPDDYEDCSIEAQIHNSAVSQSQGPLRAITPINNTGKEKSDTLSESPQKTTTDAEVRVDSASFLASVRFLCAVQKDCAMLA
jgi:hypothetical protein